jgi:hypothetical protein
MAYAEPNTAPQRAVYRVWLARSTRLYRGAASLPSSLALAHGVAGWAFGPRGHDASRRTRIRSIRSQPAALLCIACTLSDLIADS